jgi:hypothetical protein
VNGFSGIVTLGCRGAPPMSTCSMSPAFGCSERFEIIEYVHYDENATNLNHGTFTLTITAKAGADVHTATAGITVT